MNELKKMNGYYIIHSNRQSIIDTKKSIESEINRFYNVKLKFLKLNIDEDFNLKLFVVDYNKYFEKKLNENIKNNTPKGLTIDVDTYKKLYNLYFDEPNFYGKYLSFVDVSQNEIVIKKNIDDLLYFDLSVRTNDKQLKNYVDDIIKLNKKYNLSSGLKFHLGYDIDNVCFSGALLGLALPKSKIINIETSINNWYVKL